MYLSNKSELKSRVRRLHAYGPKGDERQKQSRGPAAAQLFCNNIVGSAALLKIPNPHPMPLVQKSRKMLQTGLCIGT